MPLVQAGTLVVPPLPGGSPGVDIDVDDLLAAAVETEFYYKPALVQSEAESAALMRKLNERSQSVATLVSELQQADLRAKHIEAVADATCHGVRAERKPEG